MNSLLNTLKKVKTIRADLLFFYLFLLTSSLSVRKIIYKANIGAPFNEYTSAYIYLSDIFLIGCFLLFIIYNKKSNKSILANFSPLFHVKQLINILCCSTWNFKNITNNYLTSNIKSRIREIYTQVIHNYLLIFPLVAVFFSFVSIMWTTDIKIGFFRSLKLMESVLLYYYVNAIVSHETISRNKEFDLKKIKENCSTWNIKTTKSVPCGTFIFYFCLIIVFSAVVNSLVAILQFIQQESLGLIILKESVINGNMPGVANLWFNGEKYIRAYGFMPHPNVLGGYLVFSLMCSFFLIDLFHVEQIHKKKLRIISNNNFFCSMWNNESNKYPYYIRFFKAVVVIQSLALILTFSKSAILGFLIAICFILKYKVPRETNDISSRGKLRQLSLLFLIILSSSKIFYDKYADSINVFLFKSLNERLVYFKLSIESIRNCPLFGLGAGQFVPFFVKHEKLVDWQMQPVHNVFMLVTNEYGLFFSFLFIFFIYKIFGTIVSRETKDVIFFKAALVSFVFIMVFDHYLWDLQQGIMILWVTLGVIHGYKNRLTK